MIQTHSSAGIAQNHMLAAVTAKFRGHRIDNGKIVFGNGIVIVDKDYVAIPQTKDVTAEDYAITLCKVQPSSAAQFTGLCDRAGKDIYSNDILAPYGNITLKPNMDECFAVDFSKGSYNIGNESDTDYYIVGNTYETPELLNDGSNSR